MAYSPVFSIYAQVKRILTKSGYYVVMFSRIYSATLLGLECKLIEVEVDYRHGLSNFAIVGMADKSLQEARERITTAIRNSVAEYIPKRIVVNLAPAGLSKGGVHFDLAIAVAYLLSTGQLDFNPEAIAFLGELSLDGTLRPIKGILPLVAGLKEQGFRQVFIPVLNAAEASLVEGIVLYPVHTLNEVIEHFNGNRINSYSGSLPVQQVKNEIEDFGNVSGQAHAKRALEIAAAGGHNILLIGIPGSGKTMLAKCLPGILPELSFHQAIEVTKIHSVTGILDHELPFSTTPPFRAPHHTITTAALIGGGTSSKPGEISLAHRGVLFLDEFAEFSQRSLEALRQPMESGSVLISRANYSVHYPARFQLVAAMNPCPCGYISHPTKQCTCSPLQVKNYQSKVSGPILDRIDIVVSMDSIEYKSIIQSKVEESSKTILSRIAFARLTQHTRSEQGNDNLNSRIKVTAESISHLFTSKSRVIAEEAGRKFSISARGLHKLLRVARTIADLDNASMADEEHVLEALSYRKTI